MRRLRFLTVLAVILTLPGYGLAGITHRSCQEEMSSTSQSAQAGDCCPGKNDTGTSCKQGDSGTPGKKTPCSTCKAGYNCKSPQSYEPTHTVTLVLVSERSTLIVDSPTLLDSRSPDGLWKPPRLT